MTDISTQAKRVRTLLAKRGVTLTHAQAIHFIAQSLGYRSAQEMKRAASPAGRPVWMLIAELGFYHEETHAEQVLCADEPTLRALQRRLELLGQAFDLQDNLQVYAASRRVLMNEDDTLVTSADALEIFKRLAVHAGVDFTSEAQTPDGAQVEAFLREHPGPIQVTGPYRAVHDDAPDPAHPDPWQAAPMTVTVVNSGEMLLLTSEDEVESVFLQDVGAGGEHDMWVETVDGRAFHLAGTPAPEGNRAEPVRAAAPGERVAFVLELRRDMTTHFAPGDPSWDPEPWVEQLYYPTLDARSAAAEALETLLDARGADVNVRLSRHAVHLTAGETYTTPEATQSVVDMMTADFISE